MWVDVLALYSNAAGRLHQREHSAKGFSGCWTQASMKAVYAVLILDVLTISYVLSESLYPLISSNILYIIEVFEAMAQGKDGQTRHLVKSRGEVPTSLKSKFLKRRASQTLRPQCFRLQELVSLGSFERPFPFCRELDSYCPTFRL